jgi:hypothetical protein
MSADRSESPQVKKCTTAVSTDAEYVFHLNTFVGLPRTLVNRRQIRQGCAVGRRVTWTDCPMTGDELLLAAPNMIYAVSLTTNGATHQWLTLTAGSLMLLVAVVQFWRTDAATAALA